jgi:hypothetical protein
MTTTGEPITSLPFARWKDDLAWMEDMQSARWRRAVAAETHTLNVIHNIPTVRRTATEFIDILKKSHKEQAQFKGAIQLPRSIPPEIRDADTHSTRKRF